MGQIKKLEERETEATKNLSEQLEVNQVLRKNMEGLNKKLEERDTKLNTANQVHTHRYKLELLLWLFLRLTLSHPIILYLDHHFVEGRDKRAETEDSEPRLGHFCPNTGKPGTAGAA